jgi:predicted transposase YdaD
MSEKPRIPVDFDAWGYLPGSAYEKWMLKGEAKGEVKGRAEGKQISAKVIKLFNQGLSVEKITQEMAIEGQEEKESSKPT